MKRLQQCAILLLTMLCLCMTGCKQEAKEPVLPVVSITAESLTDWEGKEDKREAELTYYDPETGFTFTQSITIKPQGNTSLTFDKKNFTIKLKDEAVELQSAWGAQSKYCLKANYIDPTHACNVVSARLVGQMQEATGLFEGLPNRGAVDGFPVWVTLNGEDAGVYTWNIPKDAWMFGMDEDNENHIVLCSEGWSDACMLQSAEFIPEEDWSLEVGDEDIAYDRFQRVVDFIVYATDEEFVEHFDEYLNLDACLNYYCFMCVSDAYDNDGKNLLMVTWDGLVWQPMLYDLDSLWGIGWNGKELSTGYATSMVYTWNRLFQRIWELYNPQLLERYAMLRDGVLSEENIWKEFDRFAAEIPEEALAWDDQYWHPNGEYFRTYELMRQQVEVYLPMVDEIFGYTPKTK